MRVAVLGTGIIGMDDGVLVQMSTTGPAATARLAEQADAFADARGAHGCDDPRQPSGLSPCPMR